MNKKSDGFFWTSFTDLMTSLFFIVLVLYVLTYITLKKKENELKIKVEDLKHKLEVFEIVEQNLKPLKKDTGLFRYEEKYKRFTLAFDVFFTTGKSGIKKGDLIENNYEKTITNIVSVGEQLQKTVDNLAQNKMENPSMKNVSYLVIISGYASHLLTGGKSDDYDLSFKRAYNLWDYWKKMGIDFEANKYKGLIDLQIAGNGWGGVGRFANESKNQRFIIQIVPKIGNTNSR